MGVLVLIYIAAPWRDKELMPDIATKFEQAGHQITHKWWLVEDTPESERNFDLLQAQAGLDFCGVEAANFLILINSAKSEGKAVEQGIALGLGKSIIAIGKLGAHSKNVFHYMSNYTWVDTITDALKVLETNDNYNYWEVL